MISFCASRISAFSLPLNLIDSNYKMMMMILVTLAVSTLGAIALVLALADPWAYVSGLVLCGLVNILGSYKLHVNPYDLSYRVFSYIAGLILFQLGRDRYDDKQKRSDSQSSRKQPINSCWFSVSSASTKGDFTIRKLFYKFSRQLT